MAEHIVESLEDYYALLDRLGLKLSKMGGEHINDTLVFRSNGTPYTVSPYSIADRRPRNLVIEDGVTVEGRDKDLRVTVSGGKFRAEVAPAQQVLVRSGTVNCNARGFKCLADGGKVFVGLPEEPFEKLAEWEDAADDIASHVDPSSAYDAEEYAIFSRIGDAPEPWEQIHREDADGDGHVILKGSAYGDIMRGKVTAYDNTELDMGGTTKATTFGNTKVTIGGDCDGSMLQAFGDTTVYAQYITDHEQVSEIHLFDSAKADVCETGDSQIHLHSLDAAVSREHGAGKTKIYDNTSEWYAQNNLPDGSTLFRPDRETGEWKTPITVVKQNTDPVQAGMGVVTVEGKPMIYRGVLNNNDKLYRLEVCDPARVEWKGHLTSYGKGKAVLEAVNSTQGVDRIITPDIAAKYAQATKALHGHASCLMCNRPLKDDASVARGYGSECAKRL